LVSWLLTTLPAAYTLYNKIGGRLMENELESMHKKMIVA
jgi:hypothetical protein